MSPVARPRILIAEDNNPDAEFYSRQLEPEFEVVGVATNEFSLFAAASALKPDVIVLDIGMHGLKALEIAKRIRKLLRTARVVYLSATAELDVNAEIRGTGVAGVVLKTAAKEELVDAVREVLKGARYLSPSMNVQTESVSLDANHQHVSQGELTDRQREVLRLLAEGRTMKEIAYILILTPRTVAFHKYKIMERFHLRTNADLIQFAIQERVVTPRS